MADPVSSDLILESLDAVPEPLRAFFQQEEGVGFKFVKPPSAEEFANAKRQQSQLLGEKKTEKQKREESERQLTELRAKLKVDDEDLDLDAVAELWREKKKALANPPPEHGKAGADAISRAEAAQERKKALEDLTKKKDTEIGTLQQQVQQLTQQLNVNVLEGGLISYCDDPKLPFKFQDGAVRTLVKILRAEQPFVVKDGKWAMRDDVTDDDGVPIETPEAWVAYQVGKQPFLLVPSQGSGSQAGGNGNGSPNLRHKRFEDMTEKEKNTLAKEDPQAHKTAVMAAAERQRAAIRARNAGVAA